MYLQNGRCVCFDDHEILIKESENASLCTCRDQTDCNIYAVGYAGRLIMHAFRACIPHSL